MWWERFKWAAGRATVSIIFFTILFFTFPRSPKTWLLGVQSYFFFSRLIMSFTGILSNEGNLTFLSGKIKYFLGYEYFFIRDVLKKTLSKNSTDGL